jgi:uncharacterized protein
MNPVAEKLMEDPRIAYALKFGSRARGTTNALSDLDIAIGLVPGTRLTATDIGTLVINLETVAQTPIDLVVIDEAPPALAYRIFAEGQLLMKRDHQAFVADQVRAVLDYLDFQPFEARVARGVIEAAARG